MEKVLGLDTGTNSMGWAVIERDECVRLIAKGVIVFPEGVKIEKGIESSKAAERTNHRALRRHYFRRRLRKIETLKILSELGLCPTLSHEQLKTWQTQGQYPLTDEFIAWQRTDDTKDKNPYQCRYDAASGRLNLDRQEDRFNLGRAFYHIAQRRGFLSNRLENTKESEGEVKKSIGELNSKIEEAGCATLGQYFYKCYGSEKIRNHYTSRLEHYKAEFDHICQLQQIPEQDKRKLDRAIFFQRPLRSQKGLVGKCTFEKAKARCPVSHPDFERYRMLCFVNNIRIKGVVDTEFRPLTKDEIRQIEPLFLRKSKATFDFAEIAKKLVGKNNYAYYKEPAGKPYLFNFKMNTTVSGSPVTAQLTELLGENWPQELTDRYSLRKGKSTAQVVNDIWHVLFSFDREESLVSFGESKLGLDQQQSKKFAKIKMPNDYASLSLKAINKIMPHLERGSIYSHAVFLANMGSIVPKHAWDDPNSRANIIDAVTDQVDNYDIRCGKTIQQNILGFLRDNFELHPRAEQRLYHSSMIETYPESENGLLGSPRTNAVRNPMAMRAMFQLRKLINQLLRDGIITHETKINIELARELNNANMRRAIEQWQRGIERENQTYRETILNETGIDPTPDDILKYRLWIEQDKVCLYTGEQIALTDFIGANPSYDIEHTIPRSIGGDNSQMNKTLTQKRFNRDVKGSRMPFELSDFEEVKVRIEPWKKRIEELEKQFESTKKSNSFATKEDKDRVIIKRNRIKLELRYWQGKYNRMVATEIEHSFRNSQGVDAGIISRYARMYLKSLFPKVYSIKGEMTAEFRKLWGLQPLFEKKDRTNHIHHCIDAITIACIGKHENDKMSEFYRRSEDYLRHGANSEKPRFEKPWKTFTEDIKTIEDEVLVSHYTPDNLGKNTKKRMRIRGKIVEGKYLQGDTARGSLHMDTYYGAIMRDEQIKYVVRKTLSQMEAKEVERIVDPVVRDKIQAAIDQLGFKEAMASTIWMNEEKRIPIHKVRCFVPSVTNPLHIRQHRDQSQHPHKQQFHVANDINYMMAIYEGIDSKGKSKREFELMNNINAATMLKISSDKLACPDIVPIIKNGLPLKCTVKTGTMVIFWDRSPEEIWDIDKHEIKKRLYKITAMEGDGRLRFVHHQLSKQDDIDAKSALEFPTPHLILRLSKTQQNMLVEGYDFAITVTGEIKQLKI